ncbi:DUF3450 domain-containing protein [Thalassotalea sp. PLHSN55]|uniref:DUF3450 domain-containing protein n=1 Tax=Thalassotalea sp. PLHSN55 TaxID=3435888 RepID=UPI003F85498F
MKRALLTKSRLAVCLGLSLVSLAYTAQAQDQELNKVVAAGTAINQSANQSQQLIDSMSGQVQTKLQAFKGVNKEIDGLNVYNEQMQSQLDSQMEELEQLANSMEQVSVIERQISPLMARMITTLESFVKLDVPFLMDERNKRVDDLKLMLKRADVSVSEKFRRVLEAYQVEAEYGRTIEAYTGDLLLDGKQRDVDFLRIGRVSFVYQTRDGSRLGQWNQASQSWQDLPESNRLNITKALRIAKKQLAPDLILVPVDAAKTVAE